MTQFRKKPLLVDAVPVDDILESNPVPEWVTEAMKPIADSDYAEARVSLRANGIDILTKQGHAVPAGSGEWLLCAAPDDLWPIDGDVFEATYERPDVPVNGDLEGLLETTDAVTWAAKFVEMFKGTVVGDSRPDDPGLPPMKRVDEATVLTWFANAIETGRAAGEQPTGEEQGPPHDVVHIAVPKGDGEAAHDAIQALVNGDDGRSPGLESVISMSVELD